MVGPGGGHGRAPASAGRPGFEAFLRQLPDPSLAAFVDQCTPCSEVTIYRRTGNRRHHYERLRDWPDGLLAIGDAFVSFNPVFAQGMTVAACEALVLRNALSAGRLPGHARSVMRGFAATAAVPWSVATGQDLRQPTSNGRLTRSQALMNAWARELSRLGVHGDARATDVLTALYHLMSSPRTLLHPALFRSALLARVRGYGPAAGRPSGLAALDSAEHPVDKRKQ